MPPGAPKSDQGVIKRINIANQAAADELHATLKVLTLQKEENYKSRDHISLLSGELDALKKVVDNKQLMINKRDKKIAELEDKIVELEEKIREITIERAAFKVLEDQNGDLLKRYHAHVKEIEALEKSNKALQADQGDVRSYADNKLSKAVETEVLLQAEIQSLKLQLSAAEIAKTAAEAERTKLESLVTDLKKSLQMVNELRVEQVNRSRVTEYKTLRRIDELSSKFVHERDEKDKMRETVRLAQMRGDLLEERLANALDAKQEEQQMVETIVSQVEFNNDAMRTREQVLERENMIMTAELKLTKKAVNDMIRRYHKLEALYEEAKTVAARAFVGKQLPFMGIGRSLEITQQHSMQTSATFNNINHPRHHGNTTRQPHPDAPPPRAKTPKAPVPDPLEPTRMYVSTLSALNKTTPENSVYSEFSSRDDAHSHRSPLPPLQTSEADESRDLLDDGERVDDEDEFGFMGVGEQALANNTLANSTSRWRLPGATTTTAGASSAAAAAAASVSMAAALPAIVTTDGHQHQAKRNVLLAYLEFLLNAQRNNLPVDTVTLSRFALTDEDLKLVLQCFRMLSLSKLRRIDLSHNLIGSKSLEAIAAWVISIAPRDLVGRTRETTLCLDLRHNHLTKRGIEKLGLKIRATPRPEVPLVSFENDAFTIAMYSPQAPLLRIDCRDNFGPPSKPLISEFINLGPSSTLGHVPFPGEPVDDGTERTIVFPRDAILNARTL